MRLHVVFMILVVWLSSSQAAEYSYQASVPPEPDNLTLDVAIKLALEASPVIAIATREREAMEGIQVQAAVRPNPSVSATMQDTRSATRETTLQLNQPFELGNKRQARMEAADARYEAAGSDIEARKAEIRAAVITAFYEVLTAQERMTLAQSSLDLAQRARDAAAKRVLAGKVSPVEETKSRVAESAVRIELNQARIELGAARKRLSSLWGNPAPRFIEVTGQLDALPGTSSLESLAGRLDESPAIKRAKLEVEQRNAFANLEKAKRVPDLTVSMGAKRNEELGINQAILGVSIPIPVFDRNQGNLQEALSRTEKAREELRALQIQQSTLLATAYERYSATQEEVGAIRTDILPGARSAYDAAVKGFEYGKFGFLDVLDAQRTFFLARSQYLAALLRGHQAMAEIERLLGDTNQAALAQRKE